MTKPFLDIPVTATATDMPLFSVSNKGQSKTPAWELNCESHFLWNLEGLSRDWAYCIANKAHVPQVSVVGVMTSYQLHNLMNKWVPNIFCEQFRILVYTSSLMYNLGSRETYCGYTQREFHALHSKAGTAVLDILEKLLRPSDIAKAVPEKLRAIFLVLFGTILAVSYSASFNNNISAQVRLICYNSLN